MTRTVETVNETLSNGKKQQKQVITETSRQMVDGVLKTSKPSPRWMKRAKKPSSRPWRRCGRWQRTITSTTSGIVDGIQNEHQDGDQTLTDGTETQKRVITQTYDDVVDGAP